MRKANGSKSIARMCMADTRLISQSFLFFSTSRTVSALLFSSVPICPLAFSSPLFWCSIVWMCIWRSSVHCISLEMMRVDSPGLLMSYTMSRMPSITTSPSSGVL